MEKGTNTMATKTVLTFIDLLQEKYPITFPKKPSYKVPLAINIFEEILSKKSELHVSKQTIQKALSLWCQGYRYYRCMIEGSSRYNLLGEPQGTVSKEDFIFARIKLKQLRKNKKNK